MVKFINGEIVVAAMNRNLTVFDVNLEILKQFDGTDDEPVSMSGNETFIAVGDTTGVVRYYERDGDEKPQVR